LSRVPLRYAQTNRIFYRSLKYFLKENYPPFKWEEMINKKDEYFIDYLLGTSALRLGIEQGLELEEVLGKLQK